MRRKIKELMNKEEGFTLVELLAVIVILGIILAIAIPAIGTVINNAQEKANVEENALIIDAARIYDIDQNIPDEGILVSELITQGYLELRGDNTNNSGTVTVVDGVYTLNDRTPSE